MENKKIRYEEKELVRVSRKKIDEIINHPSNYKGLVIYTLPVLANPNSPWINGFFEIEIEDIQYKDTIDYRNELCEIAYYNCGDELGNYLKFYIENKYIIQGDTYQEKKNNLREKAIEYQRTAAETAQSYAELAEITDFFYRNGKKYGLLKEFKENAIC